MKKLKTFVALVLFVVPTIATAQITEESPKMEFTRGSGFVIRPELYSGLLATFGYQVNPYIQLSGSIGFGFGEYSTLVTVIGIRAYTSDKSWAAFFDYHGGFESLSGINVGRHTIVAGASYKDLDFGAGIGYASLGEYSGTGLSITLGYNIRCYKHR